MNPYDNEELFRSLVVGDRKSPGKVTVRNHDRGWLWDSKTVKNQEGSNSTYVGKAEGEFITEFELVKDADGEDQFAAWDSFQAYLESLMSGGEPKAVAVYHPDLARQHYNEAKIKGISGMLHDGEGKGRVAVAWKEYSPAKSKPAKSTVLKTSKSKNAAGKTDDPNAKRKAEVKALTEEWQSP